MTNITDSALSANVTKLGASIDSSEITDGTIVNVDINAGTAVADTKLATISTAGKVADAAPSANVALLNRSPQAFTGGTNIFSGNVGVGTAAPGAKLHVTGGPIKSSGGAFSQNQNINHLELMVGDGNPHSWSSRLKTKSDAGGGPRLAIEVMSDGLGNPVEVMSIFNTGVTVAGNVSAAAFITTRDRNAKENFQPVSPAEVLAQVAALPISEWTFKTDTGTTHIGPMAQDFYSAFGVGPDAKHIATGDAEGVALAAIQGLNQKLTAQLNRRAAENAGLKARLENLEQLMEQRLKGGAK